MVSTYMYLVVITFRLVWSNGSRRLYVLPGLYYNAVISQEALKGVRRPVVVLIVSMPSGEETMPLSAGPDYWAR